VLRRLAVAAGRTGRPLAVLDAAWRIRQAPGAAGTGELVTLALDGGRFLAEQTADDPACASALAALIRADEVEPADRLLGEIVADANRRGSVLALATALTFGARLALRVGDVPAAIHDGRNASTLCRRHG